jgi:hypothetical protein
MPLSTRLHVALTANQTKALDLVTGSVPLDYSKRIDLATGTGASQADLVFSDNRTLAASGTEDLDLAGALVDAYGATLTFARVKAILVVAASANTNSVNVSRTTANGVPLFLAATDGLSVRPGGLFLWAAPDAVATVVTAGTGDLLTIANSSSGTSVSYDIVIIGASV